MATVITRPEALSLSGNMNSFILSASSAVGFVLKKGDTVLFERSYMPGGDSLITVDVKDVVETSLGFLLDVANPVYTQPSLAADFTAVIDGEPYTFRVVRCGVANLADTASNFLKLHFLSWQPKVKKVTYYSPEWLTYYAVQDSVIKLKATFENTMTREITLTTVTAGNAVTLNLQYAYVAGLLGGAYPLYYEVWAGSGSVVFTEKQFYSLQDILSEDEGWYLFENSLGGIDSFRAYGVNKLKAEHAHMRATFGDEIKEYDVEVERKYTRNTGYLNDYELRWMLDFSPSRVKWAYEKNAFRKIVLTEDEVGYASNDLPGSYSFTYVFAGARPYLNLVRNEDEIPSDIRIPTPGAPDFILPPRLIEFPRIELSGGVLFPAFDPYANEPTITTFGSIRSAIGNFIIGEVIPMFSAVYAAIRDVEEMIPAGGEGGAGAGGVDWDLIDRKIRDALGEFTLFLDDRFLRKDIDDTAEGVISFANIIKSAVFTEGYNGAGWRIAGTGNAWLDILRVRDFIHMGNGIGSEDFEAGVAGRGLGIRGYNNTAGGVAVKKWKGELDDIVIRAYGIVGRGLGSEVFTSGFPNGTGWDMRSYTRTNAAGAEETKWRLETDDVIVRGKLRVFEFVISQLRGENDNVIFAGMMKVDHYDGGTKTIYLQTDEGVLYNPFREGDILMMQRFGGEPSKGNGYNLIKQYELRVTESGIGNMALGEGRLDYIRFSHFTGDVADIAEGDVLVRVDSVADSTRKGVVKVTTIDEAGAPYIDVVYGMKTDPLHSVKARMGNLTGIRTKNNADLTGLWGLYAEGAVLENSQVYLLNGMTVEQNFVVMEGNLLSRINAVKEQIADEEGNILRNSVFGENIYFWESDSDVSVMRAAGGLMWLNKSYFADKRRVADIYRDGPRRVLRIKKTRLTQANALFRFSHEYEKEGAYSFSFFYRAGTTGTLKAGVPGTELYAEIPLTPSAVYAKYSFMAEWDGTGDFLLETDGEVFLHSLALFNDALANAVVKLQTQITQNESEIALRATKQYVDALDGTVREHFEGKFAVTANEISAAVTAINNINNTISAAGWITSSQGNTLYAAKTLESGNTIISYINQSATDIQIQANKIDLLGKVTFAMLDTSAQSTINAKANLSSLKNLAFEDKIELAMMGKSIIDGGYIKAELINANNLQVRDALNIGVFTATSLGITGTLGQYQIQVGPSGIYGESSNGSVHLANPMCSLDLKKTAGIGLTGTSDMFVLGSYLSGSTGQRFVALRLMQGAGDASWFKRTTLQLSHMPFLNHLSALPEVGASLGASTHNVKWDERTGCLYIE
jgi:hypothetical protein